MGRFLTVAEEWHRFILQLLQDKHDQRMGRLLRADMTVHIGLCNCKPFPGIRMRRVGPFSDEVRVRCYDCLKYIPSKSERREAAAITTQSKEEPEEEPPLKMSRRDV